MWVEGGGWWRWRWRCKKREEEHGLTGGDKGPHGGVCEGEREDREEREGHMD